MRVEKVGIVGAGLIGAGWAAFYASKGLAVRMYDVDSSACRAGHDRALGFLQFLKDHRMLSSDHRARAAKFSAMRWLSTGRAIAITSSALGARRPSSKARARSGS